VAIVSAAALRRSSQPEAGLSLSPQPQTTGRRRSCDEMSGRL